MRVAFIMTIGILFAARLGFSLSDPGAVQEIGVTEHVGSKVPLSLPFQDERGNPVTLASLMDGKRPVILTPVYYSCPMLCTLILNGITKAIHQMPSPRLGEDYLIITFTINPKETQSLALEKRKAYMERLGQPTPPGAWHFLTGNAESIGDLTKALGYRYKKDGEEYAHPAAIAVLTPNGEIARYLYGIEYPPKDLKLALLEASEGKASQGSIADRVLMFCYHYDPIGRTYALNALNLVKAGGLGTLACLGVFLGLLWKKERKKASNPHGSG